jgi:hypothetical protein
VRDRAVEQAGEGPQAEEGEAPERHDPAALPLGDAKLEPRGRSRVRSQVAEAAHEEQHESERQPGANREPLAESALPKK